MKVTTVRKNLDFGLLIIILILMIFGVIMVFSASFYDTISERDNPYYYLKLELIWLAISLVVMFIAIIIPYRVYKTLAIPLLIFSFILLVLVFSPVGYELNNARRWINLGFTTFMPAEYAKMAAIVFVAWYYTKFVKYIKTFFRGVFPLLCLAGAYFILIYMQPNLSTALIICGIIVGMMFVAGIRFSFFFGLIIAAVLGLVALIFLSDGFHLTRIETFLDPFADPQGSGLQVIQSLLALATGGVYGVGPGNSIQKAQYLPEAQNDFIFAIIGEEYGFIGCIVVLAVFLLLIWKGAMIAINAADRFGMLLASGITILFALQVIMNVAVVTALMPPTGVILPFISYGGNAMLVFSAAAGILLNVSRYKKNNTSNVRIQSE